MKKLKMDNGEWIIPPLSPWERARVRVIALALFTFSILNYQLSIIQAADPSGCSYPTTIDTFLQTSESPAWSVTADTQDEATRKVSLNKLQCAVWKTEVELGTLPKGSYATVKARLDDAVYISATQTLTNKTLTSPVIQGTITPGTGMAYSLSTSGVTWTWAGNTSTTNLFSLTDGASNTGTGVLGKFSTASGSSVKPFQADANGNGVQLNTSGVLGKIGTGGIDAAGLSGAVPIANGGTGQTAATAAFAALSPLTTKGDLISRDSTNPARVGVGANNTILIADSAETAGVKWGVVPLHGTGPGLSLTSNLLSIRRDCADQEILKWSSGSSSWVCTADNTAGSPSWNTVGNPSANQAFSMTTFTSTWTWGAATGTANLFTLTDTASNTGTGIMLKASTASGSTLLPAQFDANGNGVQVDTAGLLKSVGTGGIDAGAILNIVPLNRGGTGASSFTASRCVQVNSSATALEAAAAGCTASPVIDRVTSDTTVTNTATETTIYSFSVPGGTLGTNNALRLKILATFINNVGSTQGVTLRLKYGSTTIGTLSQNLGSGAVTYQMPLDALIVADGATNAQLGSISTALRNDNSDGDTASVHRLGGTSSSEDSTSSKTFSVTAQLSVANANLTYVMKGALLEKL